MVVLFVTMVSLAVAAPLVAMAWACRPRHCPHCHQTIQPDPALLRMVTCESVPER